MSCTDMTNLVDEGLYIWEESCVRARRDRTFPGLQRSEGLSITWDLPAGSR